MPVLAWQPSILEFSAIAFVGLYVSLKLYALWMMTRFLLSPQPLKANWREEDPTSLPAEARIKLAELNVELAKLGFTPGLLARNMGLAKLSMMSYWVQAFSSESERMVSGMITLSTLTIRGTTTRVSWSCEFTTRFPTAPQMISTTNNGLSSTHTPTYELQGFASLRDPAALLRVHRSLAITRGGAIGLVPTDIQGLNEYTSKATESEVLSGSIVTLPDREHFRYPWTSVLRVMWRAMPLVTPLSKLMRKHRERARLRAIGFSNADITAAESFTLASERVERAARR